MYRKFVCNSSVSTCGTFFCIVFAVQIRRTGFCCLVPMRSWWGCFLCLFISQRLDPSCIFVHRKSKGRRRAWSVFARDVPVICRTRWLLIVGTGVRSWRLCVLIFNSAESGSKRSRHDVGWQLLRLFGKAMKEKTDKQRI